MRAASIILFFRRLRKAYVPYLFAASLLISLATSSHAEVIIYTGTFDPFHKTHLDEFVGVMKQHPTAKGLVLPIDDAYYAEASGQPYPKLFPFELRLQLIGAAVGSYNATVSSSLRSIKSNVFQVYKDVARSTNDSRPILLVGPDVLKIWSDLPNFSEFVKTVEIICSTDPSTPELNTSLRERFRENRRIEFVDLPLKGLRANNVKIDILTDIDSAREALPESTYAYLKEHPQVIRALTAAHVAKLTSFLRSQIAASVIERLQKNGLSDDIAQAIQSDPDRLEDLIRTDLRLESKAKIFLRNITELGPAVFRENELMQALTKGQLYEALQRERNTLSLIDKERQLLSRSPPPTPCGSIELGSNGIPL